MFGSAARGDPGPDTDYDLLVVIRDDTPMPIRDSGSAYRAVRRLGAASDVLVWSHSEFEGRLHLKASLPATICRAGTLVTRAAIQLLERSEKRPFRRKGAAKERIMPDMSCSSYCSWIQRPVSTAAVETQEQVAREKMAVARKDPFAMELALRLAIADISLVGGESFQTCYRSFAASSFEVGDFWIILAMVCLEDKTFGQGCAGSILAHPMMEKFPEVREIAKARASKCISTVARRFQAAFDTMNAFDKRKARGAGVSSFNRLLGRIDQPEDLWIVIAALKGLAVRSPIKGSQDA